MPASHAASPLSTSGKVLMLSHTYHGQAYVAGHTPRSEYGTWTCIVVLAMVWNPWYNLTGYVELNYRKDGGMEHPMWLLADRKSKLAARRVEHVCRARPRERGTVRPKSPARSISAFRRETPMWLLASWPVLCSRPRSRRGHLDGIVLQAMGFLASVNLTFVKLGKLFAEYLKTQPTWIAAVAQQKAAKGA